MKGNVDIELAGIELAHVHFAHSLTPQLRGAAGEHRTVFAEGGYDRHEPHCFEGRFDSDQASWDADHIYYPKVHLQQTDPLSVCRAVMVRTATHKLIHRTHDRCELYDMQSDPRELTNLRRNRTCQLIAIEIQEPLSPLLPLLKPPSSTQSGSITQA